MKWHVPFLALSVDTGVKAFSCSICSASFTTNGSLTRHMATHMSLKPYKCPFCEEGFRTAIHCKKHMKRHQAVSSATSAAADTEGGGSFCFGLKVYWSNANLVISYKLIWILQSYKLSLVVPWIFNLRMCCWMDMVRVCGCMCHAIYVEDKGQLCGVDSLSFHLHMGPGHRAQVARLVQRVLLPASEKPWINITTVYISLQFCFIFWIWKSTCPLRKKFRLTMKFSFPGRHALTWLWFSMCPCSCTQHARGWGSF